MIDINELRFDEKGLIPTIVVDAESCAVLMLAYMNEESLRVSMIEGKTCFWSRSQNKLWRKGETSGNIQNILSIKTDCDKDALVVTVNKSGPACHTGSDSCFFEDIYCAGDDSSNISTEEAKLFSIDNLHGIIEDRKTIRKPGSYTTYLFDKGMDKMLKKLGEESTEIIIAAKAGDKTNTIYELADFVYHALVLMSEMGITPDEIRKELASRHSSINESNE